MARLSLVGVVIALLAYLAAANVQSADQYGKGVAFGMMPQMHAGKGDVDVDVQCTDVCNNVCTPVPQKVCNEVPYTTQVCNKVPVPKTKQVCNRICTKTTQITEQLATPPMMTSSGKGGDAMVTVSTGKGHRHLAGVDKADGLPLPLLVGKAIIAKAAGAAVATKAVAGAAVATKAEADTTVVASATHSGKGVAMVAPQTDVQCNDVCNDVQITEYQTQCDTVTNTKTKCDIVYAQKCDKVCRPSCRKITTITTVSSMPMSTGKGMPMMTMGKGH